MVHGLSVGDLAIVPMQDIIGVGSEGRMNTPSTLGGNWEWRATADQIDNKLAKRLYKYMQNVRTCKERCEGRSQRRS